MALTGFPLIYLSSKSEFNPASLYDGNKGFTLDMTDLSLLKQNSDGTGAVTAADDPIGYIQDISGNNSHATQATSGDRPLIKLDGNGKYYLDMGGAGAHFDFGENDWASSDVTIAIALNWNNDSNFVLMSKEATPSYIGLTATSAGGNTSNATISEVMREGVVTGTTTDRQDLLDDLDGGLTNAIITATTTSSFSGSFNHGLWNPTLTVWRSDIHIYAYFIIDRHLTSSEKASLTEWMGKKNQPS